MACHPTFNRSLLFLLLLSTTILFVVAEEPEYEPFNAGELYEIAGIHYWHFKIPDDLEAGEHMLLSWNILDRIEGDSAIMKTVQSNVNFDTIPSGSKVKLFLWMDVFPTTPEKAPKSLRYCLKYRDKTNNYRLIRGELNLPSNDTYYALHACQGSGVESDGNWLLMLTGAKKYSSCFLNFDFRTDPDGK